jgi:hypothetical protein
MDKMIGTIAKEEFFVLASLFALWMLRKRNQRNETANNQRIREKKIPEEHLRKYEYYDVFAAKKNKEERGKECGVVDVVLPPPFYLSDILFPSEEMKEKNHQLLLERFRNRGYVTVKVL